MQFKQVLAIISLLGLLTTASNAQNTCGNHGYGNSFDFKPLNLYISIGIIVPAVAADVCLLFIKNDTNLYNSFSIYNKLELPRGYKYPRIFLPQNNIVTNFQWEKFMSIDVGPDAYFPEEEFNKTTDFSIRPFAGCYTINKSIWQLYFDSGRVFLSLLNKFSQPANQKKRLDTQWNGTTKYGIGSGTNLTKSNAIMFGERHLHIPKRNTTGEKCNPSHDSNDLFIDIAHKL